MIKFKTQKPFLKWVGGKTQIIDEILNKFPKEINNYHELFLGGGSILFALLSSNDINIKEKIYAYDLNESLINCYNQIKLNPNELLTNLESLSEDFNSININTEGQKGKPKNINESNFKNTREHYYYWIRNKFNNSNKKSSINSAYFIFLNKTCFKGLFREGPNGFNVPYGKKDVKSIPQIFNTDEILKISQLIQNVEFRCKNFINSFEEIKDGDYVYLDPPYVPESKDSFVDYTSDGFKLETHLQLFKLINEKKNNIKFMMSNSNVELVKNNFKDCVCNNIEVKRRINSKKPESTTSEIIIYN